MNTPNPGDLAVCDDCGRPCVYRGPDDGFVHDAEHPGDLCGAKCLTIRNDTADRFVASALADREALDRLAGLLDGVEWEPSHLDDVAEAIRSTGRAVRGPEWREAVADVVAELVDEWGADPEAARAVVVRFGESGGAAGTDADDFVDEVRENTAYVVAEWMVGENMVEGVEA